MSPPDTDAVELLRRSLRFDLLRAVLQPIFRIADGSVYGYEGLVRGPSGSVLESPGALFAAADACGLRVDLEINAARTICRHFAAAHLGGFLLINASCTALEASQEETGRLVEVIGTSGLAAEGIIIELTEHERVRDATAFSLSLAALREAGAGLALDDFGSGHSNLQLWMELRPRLIKLDRVFVHGLSANGDKFEIVRFMKGLADSFGTEIVAEGIEQECDLAVVRDMGIEFAQGFLLGRPEAKPRKHIDPRAHAVLQSARLAVLPERKQPPRCLRLAGELSQPVPAIDHGTSNDALAKLLHKHSEYHAVAVTKDKRPIGLINRRNFMDALARPYYKEIYGRRSVTTLMNMTPLIVDWRAPLDSMTRILAGEDQRYLADGFIITDNGVYVGLATGDALVRAVSELRIEAARYANPLTFLPGNIPISQHIERLLAAKVPFAACYADLNNFKPFNDQYGYWRGDEMIQLAAATLLGQTDPSCDFVGHVGGDDFFVVFQSSDWRTRCERIIAEFNSRAAEFFAPAEVAAGFFRGEDRSGRPRDIPLTTIALGVVLVRPDVFTDHEKVTSMAALAKRQGKMFGPMLAVVEPTSAGDAVLRASAGAAALAQRISVNAETSATPVAGNDVQDWPVASS